MLATGARAGFVDRMRTERWNFRGVALAVGVLAIGLAFAAPALGTSAVARRWLVDVPLATCSAHADGPREYNAGRLEREFERLPDRLRTLGLALGLAALGLARGRAGSREATRAHPLGSVLLAGGLAASGLIAIEQTDVVHAAMRRGLPRATRIERFAELYPAATSAAAVVAATVPSDARVLVIDFADPDHLHVFGYVAFPLRIYTPTDPNARFDATTFRALLRAKPDVARECATRGYAAVVDLRGLVAGDARAIIPLRADGTERP
jgi:hypothetical protein